ncbi:MAG: radical SAM protein [Candidatus Thorarchaeota archaeon]|jgi:radical SAM protein with 4Fe4S-binding SPASM domain
MKTSIRISILSSLLSIRFVNRALIAIVRECSADEDSRLNVALELIEGRRNRACAFCRIVAFFVRILISLGSLTFGTTRSEVENGLSDNISVISGLAKFGAKKPFVPGSPFQIVWNVTKTCNLRCRHCYEEAGKSAYDELSTEEALLCVDRLADAGVVFLAFSGGEPTLRPDIIKLISRAATSGMYVAIATNGTTFANPERVRSYKKAGLKFVQVSLDGTEAKTHDSFRGVSGTFEKTVKGIENCVEEGLFVEVSMTVTHHNLSEVPSMIELCEDLGVKWLMLYNFVPVGRGKEMVDMDLTPSEREALLYRLWDRIESKTASKHLEVLTTAPQFGRIAREMSIATISSCTTSTEGIVAPTHFSNTRLPLPMKDLIEFVGGCGAGRFYLALEPNGDIYPCVFFPHISKVRVGNILNDDFSDLWASSRILKRLRSKDLLQGACRTCEKRTVCGGCRARALGYFDDELAPDPGCIRNMEHWKTLLKGPVYEVELVYSETNPSAANFVG